MLIIKSSIFKKYPELTFGFSTKRGLNRSEPFYFNMSLSVGDKKENVLKNRETFFHALELSSENIALQKQIHNTNITEVKKGGIYEDSDALITKEKGIGLAVSSADCSTIFIYDKLNKVIAAVHSGWRGTAKKILKFTLDKLTADFDSSPSNLIVFIGPSISQKNYEVGNEVAEQFDDKYLQKKADKFLLDVSAVNYDILLNYGVKKENIEKSQLCSFEENNLLHSYRRDAKISGRALGVIAMR
ncbi:MAG: peptidoglycan editing factor PgeF [Ignavibacteriales bacterium CG12_big_fil_rev_8_21_14_0_65_30_8]|nr:MAG: peptidoglycan editing factor PgeF [Ignavibacteriales bacterium CG12_big_fil_rev_8_21_14_0_65_30_8]